MSVANPLAYPLVLITQKKFEPTVNGAKGRAHTGREHRAAELATALWPSAC